MANKQKQNNPGSASKKKKTEPRVLFVRIVALAIAALMLGSVLMSLFY